MEFVYRLDAAVLAWINQFVGLSPRFDTIVRIVADWHFVRCGWLVCLLWWLWFARSDEQSRLRLLGGLAGIVVATGLSKWLQMVLFVHLRPFATAAATGLTMPANIATNWGAGNSFPSDTSTLHFALAVVIATVASRRWGVAAFVWVALVVAIPRVYLLYHHPIDVLAGLLLAIACVLACQRLAVLTRINRRALSFERLQPQYFYPALFVLLYQIADSFDVLDQGVKYARSMIKPAVGL